MKVLFIGGTGIISSASSQLAIDQGIDLYHLNRGKTLSKRPVHGVKQIIADIRNSNQVQTALANHQFDVVVDWISFLPEHLENNLKQLADKTQQYIFISSASAYQTPPKSLPITEKTPLDNPFWKYSRDKIACEQLLTDKAKTLNIKYTIVRPTYTYDKFTIPVLGGYTSIHRMLQGKPVVITGDGTSLWTLTHHRDFAKGLVGLLNNPKAFNEDFHITSDEWISWQEIFQCVAKALGVEVKLVGVPSHILAKYNSDMGDSLLGDKCHSMIFDNSKLRNAVPNSQCTIPFAEGAKEIVDWYKNNPADQIINHELDAYFDKVIEGIQKIGV